jgi:hypothetical protein
MLPGTDDARAPFFSPDGQSIAFFAEGEVEEGRGDWRTVDDDRRRAVRARWKLGHSRHVRDVAIVLKRDPLPIIGPHRIPILAIDCESPGSCRAV